MTNKMVVKNKLLNTIMNYNMLKLNQFSKLDNLKTMRNKIIHEGKFDKVFEFEKLLKGEMQKADFCYIEKKYESKYSDFFYNFMYKTSIIDKNMKNGNLQNEFSKLDLIELYFCRNRMFSCIDPIEVIDSLNNVAPLESILELFNNKVNEKNKLIKNNLHIYFNEQFKKYFLDKGYKCYDEGLNGVEDYFTYTKETKIKNILIVIFTHKISWFYTISLTNYDHTGIGGYNTINAKSKEIPKHSVRFELEYEKNKWYMKLNYCSEENKSFPFLMYYSDKIKDSIKNRIIYLDEDLKKKYVVKDNDTPICDERNMGVNLYRKISNELGVKECSYFYKMLKNDMEEASRVLKEMK